MKTNFKDELIENKWSLYQNQLSSSLINEYDIDRNILHDKLDLLHSSDNLDNYKKSERRNLILQYNNYGYNHKYFNCTQDHCMRSAYQYYKLSDPIRKRDYKQKNIKLKYNHFKNRKLTKDSLIKEHLWYNIKNEDSIVVSGDYTKVVSDNIKYIPNKPNSLRLNDVPVSYIDISVKNKEIINMNCNLLYFCFDMSSYCEIIDCILIMNKKRNKSYYFSYLPLEIVKYILHLTSIN